MEEALTEVICECSVGGLTCPSVNSDYEITKILGNINRTLNKISNDLSRTPSA